MQDKFNKKYSATAFLSVIMYMQWLRLFNITYKKGAET